MINDFASFSKILILNYRELNLPLVVVVENGIVIVIVVAEESKIAFVFYGVKYPFAPSVGSQFPKQRLGTPTR